MVQFCVNRIILYQDGRREDAIAWRRKSLELREQHTADGPNIARTCFNIGQNLRYAEKDAEAMPYLLRARMYKVCKETEKEPGRSIVSKGNYLKNHHRKKITKHDK